MEGYINKAAVLAAITKANKEAPMSYTHDEIVELMIEYIEKLPVEDVNELKAEVADLNNRRHLIWALGVDYDGCNTVESLKELIDELVSYTQLPREQVPDITSRTGHWVLETDEEEPNPMFKLVRCSSCEYKANHTYKFCPSCGAKMEGDA